MPPASGRHVAGLNSGPAREQTRRRVRRLNSLTRGMKMAAVNKGGETWRRARAIEWNIFSILI